jgi:hypothetical protein
VLVGNWPLRKIFCGLGLDDFALPDTARVKPVWVVMKGIADLKASMIIESRGAILAPPKRACTDYRSR